jgi:molybdenum cofactor cytidylyltransferase
MIAAIVMAAGESRRMGTQKLLLPWGETTVLEHIVSEVVSSAVDVVVVVVRSGCEAVRCVLNPETVRIVENPLADATMLDSVRIGLRALPASCEAVIVVLGDQPRLHRSVVNDLVDAWTRTGAGIVVPVTSGRRGHPLLFSMRYREEVLSRYHEQGLRGLLWAHPEDVAEVEVDQPAVLSDIDCPDEYDRELRLRESSRA